MSNDIYTIRSLIEAFTVLDGSELVVSTTGCDGCGGEAGSLVYNEENKKYAEINMANGTDKALNATEFLALLIEGEKNGYGDSEVSMEGCDCYVDVTEITIFDNEIMLT